MYLIELLYMLGAIKSRVDSWFQFDVAGPSPFDYQFVYTPEGLLFSFRHSADDLRLVTIYDQYNFNLLVGSTDITLIKGTSTQVYAFVELSAIFMPNEVFKFLGQPKLITPVPYESRPVFDPAEVYFIQAADLINSLNLLTIGTEASLEGDLIRRGFRLKITLPRTGRPKVYTGVGLDLLNNRLFWDGYVGGKGLIDLSSDLDIYAALEPFFNGTA